MQAMEQLHFYAASTRSEDSQHRLSQSLKNVAFWTLFPPGHRGFCFQVPDGVYVVNIMRLAFIVLEQGYYFRTLAN